MRRIIREEEPPRPAPASARWPMRQRRRANRHTEPAAGRSLRGDLDWIVMKALEKDRTRRYETAKASPSTSAPPERRAGPCLPAPTSSIGRRSSFAGIASAWGPPPSSSACSLPSRQ